jgi:uncharacterized protein YukE
MSSVKVGQHGNRSREKHDVKVTIRFCESEIAALVAGAAGRSVSGYIRELATAEPSPSARSLSSAQASAFIRALAPIGANIRQIARQMDSADAPSAAQIAETISELSDMLATIRSHL